MSCMPRIRGDGVHYHIILRCNNKERLFKSGEDFERLLLFLRNEKQKFGFKLYNYEFLHAHIHLMISTHGAFLIDQIMHEICLKYSKDFNRRHKRSGHLWAHRYRSRVILDDHHGLACLRYQHRNTTTAGIVARPEDWFWSGYNYYAFGIPNDLLEPHPSYLGLSENAEQRCKFYRTLVNTAIPSDKVPNILERGNGSLTRRFIVMVNQVSSLKLKIESTSFAT